MLAVAIGLIFVLAIAVSILAVVALPNLRSGSRLLTPDGERALEQARQKPVAAAGQTVRGVKQAHRVAARAWAPASEKLHEVMDRLETREIPVTDLRTGEIPVRDVALPDGAPPADSGLPARAPREQQPEQQPVQQPVQPVAAAGEPEAARAERAPIRHAQPSGPLRQKFDVTAIVGKRGVIGRPRPVPPVSGPIPVDLSKQAAPAPAATPGENGIDQVIDLRAPEPGTPGGSATEPQTGSIAARHAR